MLEFLIDNRKEGLVTNTMLDLYLNVFINQEQYEMLKAIQ